MVNSTCSDFPPAPSKMCIRDSYYVGKQQAYESSVTTKAIIAFLAIYLGIVFMIACAATVSYTHLMQEEMQKSNAEIQQMTEELSEMRKLTQSLQQSKMCIRDSIWFHLFSSSTSSVEAIFKSAIAFITTSCCVLPDSFILL